MKKPTYYIWAHDFDRKEDMLAAKEKYTNFGFRVVTLHGGPTEKNIQEGIKAVIRNHMYDMGK